jgi:hypothetical protein
MEGTLGQRRATVHYRGLVEAQNAQPRQQAASMRILRSACLA